MSLQSAITIATGGLSNITQQFGVISQNVSNAGTPNYSREVSNQQSVTAAGQGMGVGILPTTRQVNDQVQQSLDQQDALVTNLATTQTALQGIDAVQGTVGAADDLSSYLGKLQDAFSTLLNNPDNQTQQVAVVQDAGMLASQIRALSSAYQQGRQTAQNAISTGVQTLNTALGNIGSLSNQIISLRAQGLSTADLENQRDAEVQTVTNLIGIRTLEQPNGDVLLLTDSGLELPIHNAPNPFAVAGATIGAASSVAAGTTPAITLDGVDVTRQITSGSLGANVALRDTTLPTFQAELDEFAQTLTTRFSAQGLTLFTDANGQVPTGGGTPVQAGTSTQNYVGYALTMQVNAAVTATPSLVRDGTDVVAGSPTGASAFTPNTAGTAGFATLITRVLTYSFGANVQDGVAQPAPNVTGLGSTGTLSAPYTASTTLSAQATALVAAQSQVSATASNQLGAQQALQTTLSTKLQSTNGVSVDAEMSLMVQLQSAYGANAKIITAAQTMFAALLAAIK